MVTEQSYEGTSIFVCAVCGLGYVDILLTYACEQYFRQYGESSTDIVKKAVYNPRSNQLERRNVTVS